MHSLYLNWSEYYSLNLYYPFRVWPNNFCRRVGPLQWTSTSISEKLHGPSLPFCLSAFAQSEHLDGVTTFFFPSHKSNCWQSQPQIMQRYSQLLLVDKLNGHCFAYDSWPLQWTRTGRHVRLANFDVTIYIYASHPIYKNDVPVNNNKYI